jgi:hypothetical protein
MYQPGQLVVYLLSKFGNRPSRRAINLRPSLRGDSYSYDVVKYWTVAEIRDDGTLLVRTRRGKTRVVRSGDPNLRPASWWERLRLRDRFPTGDR